MKYCIILVIFFLITSCVSTETTDKENKIGLTTDINIVKIISINVSDTLPYKFEYNSIFRKNDELFFIGLDEPTNALYFYSITNQEYSHKIQKPTEGSEKFMIKDFHIYNKDSIFLLDDRKSSIQLVDYQGKQVSLIDYGKIIVPEETGFVEASYNVILST